jgi:hypothetical protein
LSIFPSTPEVNDTFTSNGTTWKWDGSSWNFFSSPAFIGVGGDATVAFQIDQPDVSELEAGALWIDSDEDISNGLLTATFTRWVSLLSASTLVLEGLDEKDLSLLYTPGFEKVYINGILLARDEDYTAEDGTTIELNVAAEEGDVAEVDVFESFAIANTYTKTQADNKFLTQNSASAEYLSQDSANETYLDILTASATYATIEDVNSLDALPSQTGNNGKYLTTDGTTASWGVLDLSTKADKLLSTNARVASYSLVLSDADKIVEMNVASANNLTVPLDSSVAFPVGTNITILQTGAGQTTIVATGGVTINGTPGLKLRTQWSSATLIKRATDTWVAIGDLVA